jgi:tryptophan-rich sensory protein
LLYVMMGIAFGIILRDRKKNMLLIMLFIDQFFFNLLWSPLFFYFNRIDLALVDIVFLWISIISFIFFARKQLILMLLFLPYSIWASFAMILNFNLFILNP